MPAHTTYTSLSDAIPGTAPSPAGPLMLLRQGSDVALTWFQVVLMVLLPSLVVFVVMDVAWISLVAAPLFQAVLGDLMRTPPNAISGLTAWVLIVGGTYFFAARTAPTTPVAAMQGLLQGLVIYGTYEMTNHSIISSWTVPLALGDMAWGSFGCACCAALQRFLIGRLSGGGGGSGRMQL